MPRMTFNMRVAALAALPLFVILTGCAAPTPANTGAGPAPTPSASSGPAPKPTPTFADVTKGDSETAAMLYSYDAAAHSAVLMPVLFMDSDTYCKKFKIKPSDDRCEHQEWVLEESHVKATVPVSPSVKLLSATVVSDDQDCVGSIEKGGACPVSLTKFQELAKAAGNDFLVHISVKGGTITRIAEEFRP